MTLRNLGGLSLENGGRPIVGASNQRQRLTILSVIAVSGERGISRDRLLALFWPESDTEHARGALNQALYALRRDVGEQELTLGTTTLRLNAKIIGDDAGEFERALEAGELEAAVQRYAGPFLDGVHLEAAAELDHWIETQRDRLGHSYRQALERLASAAAARQDRAAAVEWWRRLATADPLNSKTALGLAQALVAAGDRAGAVQHAARHEAMIRVELGLPPDPALAAFIGSLRRSKPGEPRTWSGNEPDAAEPAPKKAPSIDVQEAGPPVLHADSADMPRRSRFSPILVGVICVAAILIVGTVIAAGKLKAHRPAFALRDHTQLTYSGSVLRPAISPDGKQLAFFTKTCTDASCREAMDVQDVGGTATHRVLDGIAGTNAIEWSPDRRSLIVTAGIRGRIGHYLVSALGGEPSYLGTRGVTFYANGDSLLIISTPQADSFAWVRVASADGVINDSIRAPAPGVPALSAVPSSRWIVLGFDRGAEEAWMVIDRQGRVADSLVCACEVSTTSASALWVKVVGGLVRVPFDAGTGRLDTRRDTIVSGPPPSDFSVTADGSTLVTSEGASDYSLWALALTDALRGRFAETTRLLHGSTPVDAQVSSDGSQLLVQRWVPMKSGTADVQFSIMPFGGGLETPLHGLSSFTHVGWFDSTTLQLISAIPHGRRFALVNTTSGVQRDSLEVPDSDGGVDAFGDGWAWISNSRDHVVVDQGGRRREIPGPAWFRVLDAVRVDHESVANGRARHLLLFGRGPADSMGVAVGLVDRGVPVMWAAAVGTQSRAVLLQDGSVLFSVWSAPGSCTLFRVRGPRQIERLGTVQRPIRDLTVSGDLRRVTLQTRERRGDAWMSRVVPQ